MTLRMWCIEFVSYIILASIALFTITILLYIIGAEFYSPLRWYIPHAIHELWDATTYIRNLYYDTVYVGQVVHEHIKP
jgi:hypothetical protein